MAESSLNSNAEGVRITTEILRLIGWENVGFGFDISCGLPSKHKPHRKNNNTHHGLDFIHSYDNPLYHDRRDIIIGSIKHSNLSIKSGLVYEFKKDIVEHSVKLECSKSSDEILQKIGTSKFRDVYKGVIFCLASVQDELEADILKDITKEIDTNGINFEEIYVIDNKRATFLVSSIKAAQSYMPNAPVKFLYQNTGKNMENEQLLLSGLYLPVQMINSEVIPILKEENNFISCLLFCANKYSNENLSRLIWLVHKLCGYINEVRIYFPDYDAKNDNNVKLIKHKFKDDAFTSKISVHHLQKSSFIALKENQPNNNYINITRAEEKQTKHSTLIDDDIDKVLPFGDLLLPKLKTSLLSEPNLLNFLFKKGIITSKKTKEDLLPIFSCLLLSPEEIERLKEVIVDKEKTEKELEWEITADLKGKTLWETINDTMPSFKNLNSIKLPKNVMLYNDTFLERVNGDYNHLRLAYKLEKESTNKDFLTGKSYPEAKFEILYNNGKIKFLDCHTTSDTYKLNKSYHQNFEKALKKYNFSSESFKTIAFLDFNNNTRIQFLLSFLRLQSSKVIKVKEMTANNIKLKVDSDVKLVPKELESLKGRVATLNLYGKELNDTIYLAEEEYRNSILCEKINFSIKYEYIDRKGICNIEIAFANALTKDTYKNSELRIAINSVANSFDTNFNDTKKVITTEIGNIKNDSYNKFKN